MVSSDGMEYDMSEGDRTTRGSTITLYMNEDSLDFLEPARIREVLDKYCAFMPIPIYLNIIGQTEEVEVEDESAEPAEATEGDKAEAAEGDKAESKPKKARDAACWPQADQRHASAVAQDAQGRDRRRVQGVLS